MLSGQLDERETEARDKQEGTCAKQRGPESLGGKLSNVRFQTHRRKRDREQKRGQRGNPDPCLSRDADEAVDAGQCNEAEDKPGNRRAGLWRIHIDTCLL